MGPRGVRETPKRAVMARHEADLKFQRAYMVYKS